MTAYTPDIVAKAFIDEGMRRNVNPIGTTLFRSARLPHDTRMQRRSVL
jgi:hypothetical protein